MIRTFQLPPPGVPPRLKRRERTPVAEGGTMGEKLPRILPKVATSTSLLGYFICRKFTIWDRRLYFPSEGRRAEDFFRTKNPTASAGFEPANLGTRGQHAYLYRKRVRRIIISGGSEGFLKGGDETSRSGGR